jgi:thiol:disulfide interchange protein
MKWINSLILLVLLFTGQNVVKSQILEPVTWEISQNSTDIDGEYYLIFNAHIDEGWKVYSNKIEDGGPVKTDIIFDTIAGFELIGELEELGKMYGPNYDEFFDMDLKWYKKKAIFRQKIKLIEANTKVTGFLEYMTCDDTQCLPPTEVPFEFVMGKNKIQQNGKKIGEIKGDEHIINENKLSKFDDIEEKKGLWGFLIAGFAAGLLALLTPCVFPMIPLTVSFFTKSSSNKKKGLANALIYALSIIAIFVLLGFLITILNGPSALNAMASNKFFNLLFFLVFILFALSFFGVFEITLPSGFVNKMDAKSDKGGIIGIFFMAFTLVLVSFSCTAPIVGSLLVIIADNGGVMGPFMGLFGFSLALAIPFALFAAFPGWLNSLPKSGGWLNTVKVSLGFIELALAFKFLSVADLAYHWDFLTRDIFLALWIVIAILLGAYLIGKIKFVHDDDNDRVSVTRLFFGIMAFAFAIYMVPGLWGAPVKLLSGIAPPAHYQEFSLSPMQYKIKKLEKSVEEISAVIIPQEENNNSFEDFSNMLPEDVANVGECPHEFTCQFDLQRGMMEARKQNKPLLLDFTGWSCVNCRKMEDNVWSDPKVWDIINEKYILVSLYVDDKTGLPDDFRKSVYTGEEVSTIGKLWSNLQREWFNTNSQPYYVIMDHSFDVLIKPKGFTPSIDGYAAYLNQGVEAFKAGQLANKE